MAMLVIPRGYILFVCEGFHPWCRYVATTALMLQATYMRSLRCGGDGANFCDMVDVVDQKITP
jgi:hypothetical protein